MSERKKAILRWGALAAGILFLLIGQMRGEFLTVWMKAVNICLECIGIG